MAQPIFVFFRQEFGTISGPHPITRSTLTTDAPIGVILMPSLKAKENIKMMSNESQCVSRILLLVFGGQKRIQRVVSTTIHSLALTALIVSGSAVADGAPDFFKNSLPEHAIEKMLESYGAFQGEGAMLDVKTRELIALGVAAQIPCTYCVYAHRNNALKAGASEAEVREAVAAGAYVRFWSTMFQGAEIDLEAFKAEHDKLRAAK